MNQTESEGLKRVIGVRQLAASAINLTVGAGIFALPAVVAGYLGSASYLAYMVCTVLLMLMLLCFISLGTKLTTSGGAYAYVEYAFGPYAGFLINSLYWFGFCIIADAAVANLLVDNLSIFFPVLKEQAVRVTVLAAIFTFVAWLNVRGVQQGVRLIEINTLAKLIPLFVLIVAGCFFIDTNNYNWSDVPSMATLGEVSLILFFAFGGGAETTLNASGEIKNPVRTIPRGLLIGVFFVFVIYLLIHLVAQGVLGSELAIHKEAPLAKVAEKAIGPFGVGLLVAGAAISCFGLVSGDILASSRLLFAAARDGMLPNFLAKVHPKFATPYWSIIVFAGTGFLFSVSGGFRELAILASASLLVIYLAVVLAAIKLRNYKKGESFTIPGGLLVPVLAIVVTIWFLYNLPAAEQLSVLVFLAVASVIYGIAWFVKRTAK